MADRLFSTMRRCRVRYSLKAALLAVLVIAAVLALWRPIHMQKRAVEALRRHGGYVYYDVEIDRHRDGWRLNRAAWDGSFAYRVLGKDAVAHIEVVGLDSADFSKDEIYVIQSLHSVKTVVYHGAREPRAIDEKLQRAFPNARIEHWP